MSLYQSPITFIMPAYNCAATVEESVRSIMNGNFNDGDELIIVNDCSTDSTSTVLSKIQCDHPRIKVLDHHHNRGGGAARNTAVRNASNDLIFCLDSDNILIPGSVRVLKECMQQKMADVIAFQEIHYFRDDPNEVTHAWDYGQENVTFSDYISRVKVPGTSGNYLYTKDSWIMAGGYPESSGALDTWGFGLRQVATGSVMSLCPSSHYMHRAGHESYWVRDSRNNNTSIMALGLLIPYLDRLEKRTVDYLFSKRGRYCWFDKIDMHPLLVRS